MRYKKMVVKTCAEGKCKFVKIPQKGYFNLPISCAANCEKTRTGTDFRLIFESCLEIKLEITARKIRLARKARADKSCILDH
ncbi:hypothetical protein BIV59_05860 [Bacillus sp. MUM 13]|nr:hypothetical protein BIV59_05860 [Bacillus sp. MUM 13]